MYWKLFFISNLLKFLNLSNKAKRCLPSLTNKLISIAYFSWQYTKFINHWSGRGIRQYIVLAMWTSGQWLLAQASLKCPAELNTHQENSENVTNTGNQANIADLISDHEEFILTQLFSSGVFFCVSYKINILTGNLESNASYKACKLLLLRDRNI